MATGIVIPLPERSVRRPLAAAVVLAAGLVLIATAAALPPLDSGPGRSGIGAGAADVARRAFAAGNYPAAHQLALAALGQAPLDQRNLTIAALTTGDLAWTKRALGLSAALGWRDPATQALLAESALQTGDVDLYAERIRALAIADASFAVLPTLVDRGLARPGTMAALLPLLRQDRPWRTDWWSSTASGPEVLHARAKVWQRLAMSGVTPDLREAAVALVGAMRREGADVDAWRLWRALDRRSGSDAGLATIESSQRRFPYEWKQPQPVAAAIEPIDGGGLRIDTFGTPSAAVLERDLGPEPITWRITYATGTKLEQPPLRWRLRCAGLGDQFPKLSLEGTAFVARVAVPPACRRPMLEARLGSEQGGVLLKNLTTIPDF